MSLKKALEDFIGITETVKFKDITTISDETKTYILRHLQNVLKTNFNDNMMVVVSYLNYTRSQIKNIRSIKAIVAIDSITQGIVPPSPVVVRGKFNFTCHIDIKEDYLISMEHEVVDIHDKHAFVEMDNSIDKEKYNELERNQNKLREIPKVSFKQ